MSDDLYMPTQFYSLGPGNILFDDQGPGLKATNIIWTVTQKTDRDILNLNFPSAA